MLSIKIAYTDGRSATLVPEDWPSFRSDGVDSITISNDSGHTVFTGHSVYWLYKERDTWIAGQAPFGYSETIPPEVLFLTDGTMDTREIEFVPDLQYASVKLGWWRSG